MKYTRSLSFGLIFLMGFFMSGCATAPKQSQPLPPTTAKNFVDPKELDSTISVFSEAIKNDPNYAGAYYNRSIAYFYKNEFDKSWQDVHKAMSLGCKFNPDFLELLRRASGKEK